MKYLTTAEAGLSVGLSGQRIRALCAEGRVAGARQVGRAWIIPDGFTIARNGARGPKNKYTK